MQTSELDLLTFTESMYMPKFCPQGVGFPETSQGFFFRLHPGIPTSDRVSCSESAAHSEWFQDVCVSELASHRMQTLSEERHWPQSDPLQCSLVYTNSSDSTTTHSTVKHSRREVEDRIEQRSVF